MSTFNYFDLNKKILSFDVILESYKKNPDVVEVAQNLDKASEGIAELFQYISRLINEDKDGFRNQMLHSILDLEKLEVSNKELNEAYNKDVDIFNKTLNRRLVIGSSYYSYLSKLNIANIQLKIQKKV